MIAQDVNVNIHLIKRSFSFYGQICVHEECAFKDQVQCEYFLISLKLLRLSRLPNKALIAF